MTFTRHIVLTVLAATIVAAPLAAAPPANTFQQRLMGLDEQRQAAALRAAVVDSGERCGRISRPLYRGPYKNMFFWAARCTPGGDYALFLGPDGSVQLRRCEETAKLGLPACNLPPAPPPAKPRRG